MVGNRQTSSIAISKKVQYLELALKFDDKMFSADGINGPYNFIWLSVSFILSAHLSKADTGIFIAMHKACK
jgi:hypothetical protein